jgi:hypothetical protein
LIHLPGRLSACPLACLSFRPLAWLPVFLPANSPTYPMTYVPAHLLI